MGHDSPDRTGTRAGRARRWIRRSVRSWGVLGVLLATVVPAVAPVSLPAPAAARTASAAAPADDPCVVRLDDCPRAVRLYEYSFTLGFHPFTSAQDVRTQLTDHFWLFPVSGRCRGDMYQGRDCDLLGGNPVTVELVGADHLQIATRRGHMLGSNLHIRFTFSRKAGMHILTVRAWQNSPQGERPTRLRRESGKALAWPLWAVLADTLKVTAYAA
ncbi:hypothetical protein DSC45_20340 [Streptomyces sp. YIM 130001]|uniref:hypothetical protein n=1 Tax=Streptomyces sp. YIM 130001 TaxID=2259644 RepID=UPI000EB96EEC|nr:hypothetical protein [Streptomyces sp. YIM 130001]RII14705.1 hypothetical protein DSC45_20340 [Streptomyces sp. YIM 130001]